MCISITFLLVRVPPVAFRGTYMARLRNFHNAADAVCLKSRNKRRSLSLASQMSQKGSGGGRSREPADVSQPSTARRPTPASRSAAAVAPESSTPDVVRSRRSGRRAVSVPLDLALPHLAVPDFRAGHLQVLWVREYEYDCPPQLGEPVVLNLSRAVPGSDAPVMSFPVYPLPCGMAFLHSRAGGPRLCLRLAMSPREGPV